MGVTTDMYQKIKQDVFQAKFKPNVLITEKKIAERYAVSKVTASAALHRLCSEGHLTNYPRSGYMVTMLSQREMQQLKRMRAAVESLVLDIICAEAADKEIQLLSESIVDDFTAETSASISNSSFHMRLARLTQDGFAITLVENMLGSLSRVEHFIAPDRYSLWQGYHQGIVDSLLARDSDKAKEFLIKDINQ